MKRKSKIGFSEQDKLVGGVNFRAEDGRLYVVRCPLCDKENYAPNVASGTCTWCGWSEVDLKQTKGDK